MEVLCISFLVVVERTWVVQEHRDCLKRVSSKGLARTTAHSSQDIRLGLLQFPIDLTTTASTIAQPPNYFLSLTLTHSLYIPSSTHMETLQNGHGNFLTIVANSQHIFQIKTQHLKFSFTMKTFTLSLAAISLLQLAVAQPYSK